MENQWRFDKTIASNFVNHARCHIPDYDKVIKLSVDICKIFEKNSKIIDVGCATGETLRRLDQEGFTNIWGVDNSQAMLDQCTVGKTILSDTFPTKIGPFKVVIINWTLHFIKEKEKYLTSIIDSLEEDGILILSDKIDNSEFSLEHYHNFKRIQGVSEEDIKKKAESLVGVMHIDDISWYISMFQHLKLNYHLANGFWSFATFVCRKKGS